MEIPGFCRGRKRRHSSRQLVGGSSYVADVSRYTSQRCSACGHVALENRKSQAVFERQACNAGPSNADVNAARNIAAGRAVTARGDLGAGRSANREPQLCSPAASVVDGVGIPWVQPGEDVNNLAIDCVKDDNDAAKGLLSTPSSSRQNSVPSAPRVVSSERGGEPEAAAAEPSTNSTRPGSRRPRGRCRSRMHPTPNRTRRRAGR